MSSCKSVAEIYGEVKRGTKPIAQLTARDVAAYCDGYRRPAWLLAQLRNLATAEAKPKPRRKAAPQRQRKDTGRKPRNQRNSAAAAFNAQMTATLKLVERANEVEKADPNPLRLFNTTPGEQFPRFKVIRPKTPADVLEDLADALPDSGYRMTDYEERL